MIIKTRIFKFKFSDTKNDYVDFWKPITSKKWLNWIPKILYKRAMTEKSGHCKVWTARQKKYIHTYVLLTLPLQGFSVEVRL